MSGNTKYQPVAGHDSYEDHPSSAPPSYQAEAANINPSTYGVPRNADEELPDDFKFGGVVSEATIDIRMAFIRKVYTIL